MTAKKKILLGLGTLVAVVAIVVASVAGTVAYLTSSAAVLNAFTIGDVAMTMFESKVNPDGKILNADGTVWNGTDTAPAKNADTNSYHLVSNTTYTKDPTIYIQPNSDSSYIFIAARNDIKDIEAPEMLTMREQMALKGWMKYTTIATSNVYVYTGAAEIDGWEEDVMDVFNSYATELSQATTLQAKQAVVDKRVNAIQKLFTDAGILAKAISTGATEIKSIDLFSTFTVAEQADRETLKLYGGAEVKVTAVAIQTSGFGRKPGTTDEYFDVGSQQALKDAWDAVIETYPYIHTNQQ